MSNRSDKIRGARKRHRQAALAKAAKVLRAAAALRGTSNAHVYEVRSRNGIPIGCYVVLDPTHEMHYSRNAGYRIVEEIPF